MYSSAYKPYIKKKARRVKQTRLTHTDNNTDQTHKKIKKEVKCELLI